MADWHGPLDDRDIMDDVLGMEKYMSDRLHQTSLEVMHPQLRQVVNQVENDTRAMASHVFNYEYQRGWYRPRAADQNTLSWFNNALNNLRSDIQNTPAPQPFNYQPLGGQPGQQFGVQANQFPPIQFGQRSYQ
ncbi:MAG: spore coat protein [Firmicutes bacterium]|nr:spore coat protein [Bacillota bacterium]